MALHLRAWRQDDIAEICVLLEKTWKAAYRGIIDSAYLDAVRAERWTEVLREGLRTGAAQGFVAWADEIIGVAIWSDAQAQNLCGELTALYVLPHAQGSSVGKQLLHTAEESMQNAGMKRSELTVLQANTRACRFYAQNGYHMVGNVSVPLGAQQVSCQIMRKTLDSI